MTETVQELHIHIRDWPTRNDIQEYIHQNDSHRKITEFLTLEFDTMVSFKVGDVDLLSGYDEAFFLPLHAFIRQLSLGMKSLVRDNETTFPIFLQQYEVAEGDPAHRMTWKRKGDRIHVSMEWGGQVEAPAVIKSFSGASLTATSFQTTIIDFIDVYVRKIMMLLGSHAKWKGEEISALFEDF